MSLGYLLNPALQLENIDGKPLVGGYLVTYLHGTTTPYITYADFDGNHNPAKVPLNARGMAILLADADNLYDVYCYDCHDIEQWSRINIGTIGTGGEGGAEVSYEPSLLRTSSAILNSDGDFQFNFPDMKVGNLIDVVGSRILVKTGFYHFSVTAKMIRMAEAQNTTRFPKVHGPANDLGVSFDMTYAHNEEITLSGDVRALADDFELRFWATGVGNGIQVLISSISVHAITSLTAGVSEGILPSYGTQQEGKVLRVNSSGTDVEWGTSSGELPPYDSADAGKALVVNNEGDNVEWKPVGSSVTVDQHYDSSSSNAQSGTAVAEALESKQDTISDLSEIRSGAEAGATAVQRSDLATVATTGDYGDLLNKPVIPTVNNGTLYFGLGTDTPVPKFTANQSGNSTIVVPYRTYEQTGSTTIFSKGLCTIEDLDAIYTQPDWNASSGVAAIKNKPTIPTVNNGTLIIKQGTSTLGTFKANQSGSTTVTISDPANLPKRYFLHDAVNIDRHQTFQDFQYEYTLPNDFDASVGYVMNATFQIQRPTNKSWSIGDTAIPIYFAIHTQNGTSVAFQSSTMFSNINGSYANYLACISTTHEFSPTTFQEYRKLYFDITIPSAYRSTVDQLYFIADMYFVEEP